MVHEEVEETALDVAAALRSVRKGSGVLARIRRLLVRQPPMTGRRLAGALLAIGVVLLCLPGDAHAWTPGTHIYLAESVLGHLRLLPTPVADLLRAFPFDFLYGNIAADSSIAKKYAPVGRHCHFWHVGQEIHDLAASDALRAFGLGYLAHLAADTVAHNYFVPRQLMVTSSTASFGHSYWETRVELHLGDAYAKAAKDVILLDHAQADQHLDRIISPTLFSVRTNRRLFRGMVRLTETDSWQRAAQAAREVSRWDLTDDDVERHLGLAFDSRGGRPRRPTSRPRVTSIPREKSRSPRRRSGAARPSGTWAAGTAPACTSWRRRRSVLPPTALVHWPALRNRLPWRQPEGAAPSPRLLAASDG